MAEKQIPICPALPLLVNALDATGAEMSAASRDGLKRAKTRDRWQRKEHPPCVRRRCPDHGRIRVRLLARPIWLLTCEGDRDPGQPHVGVNPVQAISGGTLQAARTLPRWEVGSIEPGKLADLLVLDGNPSNDISILSRKRLFKMVMQAGREVDITTPLPERVQQRFEKQHVDFNGLHSYVERWLWLLGHSRPSLVGIRGIGHTTSTGLVSMPTPSSSISTRSPSRR